jgi:hypothetical protein
MAAEVGELPAVNSIRGWLLLGATMWAMQVRAARCFKKQVRQ